MKAEQPTAHPDVRETIAYAELLKLAHEEGLKSIATELVLQPSEDNGRLAIVKAAVETERGHFEGLGDADPCNVEDFLAPHLSRVAETRAKARALRDAVNSGVVSIEELDGVRPEAPPSRPGSGAPAPRRAPARATNGAARRSIPAEPPANGADGPMTEPQRRYLFRLLAARGHTGKAAGDHLFAEYGVEDAQQLTCSQASALIEQLLQTPVPTGRGGNGAARPQQ